MKYVIATYSIYDFKIDFTTNITYQILPQGKK